MDSQTSSATVAASSSIGREAGTTHRRITSFREVGSLLIGRVSCKRPAGATQSEGGATVQACKAVRFSSHASNH